jgi:hypothetical protein
MPVQSRSTATGAAVGLSFWARVADYQDGGLEPLGSFHSLGGVDHIYIGEDPPGHDTWGGSHRDLKRLARLRTLLDLAIVRLAN